MSKKLNQTLLVLVLFSLTLQLTLSQVFAQESFNISLKSGKNLVSLPLILQNTAIQSVLSSIIGAVKDVWQYQPSNINDPWKHYRPGLDGYSDLSQMNVGKGYWINLKSDAILQVTGTPVAENITFNLKQGWNIIGWPYQYPQQITEALSGLTFGLDYNQVTRFNNTTQAQENFLNQPGRDDFSSFEPARAYYIYMLKDKTISIPLDTTPPTGSIKINNDNPYTNSTSVTLDLSAQDNPDESGISQMQFSNDNTNWSAPEAYSTTKSWTLTSGDDTKTVYAKFKDVAGNWSQAYSDTIILDTIAPEIPTIDPVTSPTDISSQALTGTKSTDTTSIIVDCPTATVGQVTYPSVTTWSCQLTNLTAGINTITIRARDSAGNESDSAIADIVYNQTPQIGTIAPSSGTSTPGQEVTFTTTFSDPDGWQDIQYVHLLINYTFDPANCFVGYYNQNANMLYLMDDGNTGWIGGFVPGSNDIIENSYVKLDCSQTTVLGQDTTLTVTWSITFKPTFTGTKNMYLYVKDDSDAYDGWLQKGTWTISNILSISVNPKLWNIGLTQINEVLTMTETDKITVTNDGTGPETFELKLINPWDWTASTQTGKETYVLSGLFCKTTDVPQDSQFNQDASYEDVITTESKKATSTIFGYSQGTANGVAVPSGEARSLYLQFKSPTITQKREEQNISVIVSCQIP